MAFPADFNTSTAMIKIYHETTSNGKTAKQRMGTDEIFTLDFLKQKYSELSGTSTASETKYDF
jgi:hypothetical protein